MGHQCPSHGPVPAFFLLRGSQGWEFLLYSLPPIIAEKHNTLWIPLVNSFISFSAFSLITPVTAFPAGINGPRIKWPILMRAAVLQTLSLPAHQHYPQREAQLLQLFPSFLKPLQCIYSSTCTEPSQAPSSQSPALGMTRIPPKKPMVTMP